MSPIMPFGSSNWSTEDGRTLVVAEIMLSLMKAGSFSVGGLEQFWKNYRQHLCYSCQAKLDSLSQRKREALGLLEEAVRLDSGNKAAKQNLEAVKRML